MLKFSDFLIEKAGESMGGDVRRSISHLRSYVLPFLNSKQKSQIKTNFENSGHGHYVKFDPKEEGNLYHPEDATHSVVSRFKNDAGKVVEPGTNVKVVGAKADDAGKIILQTKDHGDIPLTKLGKPKELAKTNPSQAIGLGQEKLLQQLYDPDIETAGASKQSHDAVYVPQVYKNNPENGAKTKVVKSVEDPGQAPTKPEAGTELKTTSRKKGSAGAGQSPVIYDEKTKRWAFTNSEMGESFARARHKNGDSVLDYLNKNHNDGIIPKYLSFNTKGSGITKDYVKSTKATALHLHKVVKDKSGKTLIDRGTTFEVNNGPYTGKTGLSRLSDEDLDNLNGTLSIAPTVEKGKTTAKHNLHTGAFEDYSRKSEDDPTNHRSHMNPSHVEEYKKNIDKAAEEMEKRKGPLVKTAAEPKQVSNEMFGRQVHADHEMTQGHA
jgi:hypothetical protein